MKRETVVPPGQEGSELHDELWSFTVDWPLKVSVSEGEIVVVRTTAVSVLPDEDGRLRTYEHDSPAFEVGSSYTLFLRRIDFPGAARWTFAAHPRVAPVQDGLVTFERSEKYEEALAGRGGLGAVTLEQLATIARSPQPSRPASTTSPGADEVGPRGAALNTLVAELSAMTSADQVIARVAELGLTGQALRDEPFCRKVETVVTDLSGLVVDLGCAE